MTQNSLPGDYPRPPKPNRTAEDALKSIPADLDAARRDCRALYALLEAARAERDRLAGRLGGARNVLKAIADGVPLPSSLAATYLRDCERLELALDLAQKPAQGERFARPEYHLCSCCLKQFLAGSEHVCEV